MKKTCFTCLLTLLFAITLSACTATGTIRGISDGAPVQIEYEQEFLDKDGLLSITMPSGEVFSGKFVQTSSTETGADWEIGESSDDDRVVLRDSDVTYSNAEAVLLGDNNNTMHCRFQFSKPFVGIDGGGIGRCKTSDDQSVNVTF